MPDLIIRSAKKEIIHGSKYNLSYNKKGEIIALDNLKVGKIVYDKRMAPYKIRKISCNGTVYAIEFFEDTLSTIFLTPLLGGYRTNYLWDRYFINAYFGDFENKIYPDQNVLILLFRDVGNKIFYDLEKWLIKREDYLGDNKPDKYHIQFLFDLDEYAEDFKLFVDGQYSKISENTKQRILEFHNFGLKGVTAGLLYQHPGMRRALLSGLNIDSKDVPEDIELYSKPSLEVEMYRSELKLLAK